MKTLPRGPCVGTSFQLSGRKTSSRSAITCRLDAPTRPFYSVSGPDSRGRLTVRCRYRSSNGLLRDRLGDEARPGDAPCDLELLASPREVGDGALAGARHAGVLILDRTVRAEERRQRTVSRAVDHGEHVGVAVPRAELLPCL